MKTVYLEASAFFRAYRKEAGSEVLDLLLDSLRPNEVVAVTSRLTVLEILRGITRRRNTGDIPKREAEKLMDSILLDLDTRAAAGTLRFLDVETAHFPLAASYIRRHNFYAMDALHLATALMAKPDLFLHGDDHFKARVVEESLTTLDVRDRGAARDLKKMISKA